MDDRIPTILARLRRRFANKRNVAEVEAYLSSKGFDRGQIGTIVSAWLAEIEAGDGSRSRLDPLTYAIRVQGPHEEGRFSAEAWGHLLTLRASGVLNSTALEMVIERVLDQAEGQVTLDDVEAVLESAGWNTDGSFGAPSTVQ
jgi:Smg protein